MLYVEKQPPKVFCKKRCSQKFRKFHRKHLYRSLFLIKLQPLKLLFVNVSLNFTPRHEKDVVIATYIPFIKFLLYIKRGQTKGLEVWSNFLKFVVNFIYIWEYNTSKPHQKRSKKTQAYRIR